MIEGRTAVSLILAVTRESEFPSLSSSTVIHGFKFGLIWMNHRRFNQYRARQSDKVPLTSKEYGRPVSEGQTYRGKG
jgi:hypothetical protein